MKPTKRNLLATRALDAQPGNSPGTSTIVHLAQTTTSSDGVLTQARAQTDRLVLALLAALTCTSLAISPLHNTWIWGFTVGPFLLAVGVVLHRWRPGAPLMCQALGIALGVLIGLLD